MEYALLSFDGDTFLMAAIFFVVLLGYSLTDWGKEDDDGQ